MDAEAPLRWSANGTSTFRMGEGVGLSIPILANARSRQQPHSVRFTPRKEQSDGTDYAQSRADDLRRVWVRHGLG